MKLLNWEDNFVETPWGSVVVSITGAAEVRISCPWIETRYLEMSLAEARQLVEDEYRARVRETVEDLVRLFPAGDLGLRFSPTNVGAWHRTDKKTEVVQEKNLLEALDALLRIV